MGRREFTLGHYNADEINPIVVCRSTDERSFFVLLSMIVFKYTLYMFFFMPSRTVGCRYDLIFELLDLT